MKMVCKSFEPCVMSYILMTRPSNYLIIIKTFKLFLDKTFGVLSNKLYTSNHIYISTKNPF